MHAVVHAAHGHAAEHRLECALDALAMPGVKAPSGDDPVAVHRLMEHMAIDGGSTRWARHYVPATKPWATDETCAVSPWAWVDEQRRQKIRDRYGAMLFEAFEKPQELPCPDPTDGCLMCGVNRVWGLPSKVKEVWTLTSANSANLGGSRELTTEISGHMCPECSAACWAEGTVCIPAMERSLLEFVGVSGYQIGSIEVEGIVAWGIPQYLRAGVTPAPTRWAFVALPQESLQR